MAVSVTFNDQCFGGIGGTNLYTASLQTTKAALQMQSGFYGIRNACSAQNKKTQ
jgi:hypothetical protein